MSLTTFGEDADIFLGGIEPSGGLLSPISTVAESLPPPFVVDMERFGATSAVLPYVQ